MSGFLSSFIKPNQTKQEGLGLAGKLAMLTQRGRVHVAFYDKEFFGSASRIEPHWNAQYTYQQGKMKLEIKSDDCTTAESAVDNLINKMQSVKALT